MKIYRVQSQSDPKKTYDVRILNDMASCTCPYYEFKGFYRGQDCKHIRHTIEYLKNQNGNNKK